MKPHTCPVCEGTKVRTDWVIDFTKTTKEAVILPGAIKPMKPTHHQCIACNQTGIVWEIERDQNLEVK